ncbi:VOC family protein [Consotaella aegiceratis]|uniref:VOC family protein n=1 Tax=Consotaella aegiceratis TaxID=3097961 RepID=UPI002F4209E4
MFSHVHIGTNDLDRVFAFYAPLMEALGLALKFHEPDEGWVGWMQPGVDRPLFLVGRPYDGQPASPGNGEMTAFLAESRATVDRCHAIALAHGGASEGEPGLRPQYHPNYYGAYFRDPDGNKLCVVCHRAEG